MSVLIEENGVKVQFPDNNYFQFGQCPAYIAIKGKGVKETDVCWFDILNNTLWFVELKAFHNPANLRHQEQDLSNGTIVNYWITELANKSIHAVSMANTNRGQTQTCLPIVPDNATIIKVVHLLKVIPGQDAYLNPMQDKLRIILQPYSAIFNISSITIISYDFAVQNNLLSWIV